MGDTQPQITEERRRTSAAAGRPQRLTAATHTGKPPLGDSQRSEVTHRGEQAGEKLSNDALLLVVRARWCVWTTCWLDSVRAAVRTV